MKKIILLFLLCSSALCYAQFKIDIGITGLRSVHRQMYVGMVRPFSQGFNDTSYKTLNYSQYAGSIYVKPIYYTNKIGNSFMGGLSLPVNAGIGGIVTKNNKTLLQTQYDAALLYQISVGNFLPEGEEYNSGFFIGAGLSYLGFSQEISYETESLQKSKATGTIHYLPINSEIKLISRYTIGPVFQAGFAFQALGDLTDLGPQGFTCTYRPGIGKGLSYFQISYFLHI